DPFVDWSRAELVAVRSTWDYTWRLPEFLGWAGAVGSTLLHGVGVFRWNTDKSYLVELAEAGLPLVPTALAGDVAELRAAVARFTPAVVKPRVGAGGRGLVVIEEVEGWAPDDQGPWVVQPLVRSVQDEGEISVFVLGGRPVSQVRKVAGPDDIRVHEWHGGTEHPTPLAPEAARLAVDAMAAAGTILGTELVYGRVDMMRHEGSLVVSEIEVTEPGLYLDLVPENAETFADAIAARL
ncbi:MAG: hypothetical protein JWO11_3341, partial [Nocardioides sp.]|nr:hypothetical protein [Nocardioides sp.]